MSPSFNAKIPSQSAKSSELASLITDLKESILDGKMSVADEIRNLKKLEAESKRTDKRISTLQGKGDKLSQAQLEELARIINKNQNLKAKTGNLRYGIMSRQNELEEQSTLQERLRERQKQFISRNKMGANNPENYDTSDIDRLTSAASNPLGSLQSYISAQASLGFAKLIAPSYAGMQSKLAKAKDSIAQYKELREMEWTEIGDAYGIINRIKPNFFNTEGFDKESKLLKYIKNRDPKVARALREKIDFGEGFLTEKERKMEWQEGLRSKYYNKQTLDLRMKAIAEKIRSDWMTSTHVILTRQFAHKLGKNKTVGSIIDRIASTPLSSMLRFGSLVGGGILAGAAVAKSLMSAGESELSAFKEDSIARANRADEITQLSRTYGNSATGARNIKKLIAMQKEAYESSKRVFQDKGLSFGARHIGKSIGLFLGLDILNEDSPEAMKEIQNFTDSVSKAKFQSQALGINARQISHNYLRSRSTEQEIFREVMKNDFFLAKALYGAVSPFMNDRALEGTIVRSHQLFYNLTGMGTNPEGLMAKKSVEQVEKEISNVEKMRRTNLENRSREPELAMIDFKREYDLKSVKEWEMSRYHLQQTF